MIWLQCPVCGLRAEGEFSYGGDASSKRPDDSDTDLTTWHDFVFLRDNPRGPHVEFWHHVLGCRQWLVVERDTLTHKIGSVRLAREAAL